MEQWSHVSPKPIPLDPSLSTIKFNRSTTFTPHPWISLEIIITSTKKKPTKNLLLSGSWRTPGPPHIQCQCHGSWCLFHRRRCWNTSRFWHPMGLLIFVDGKNTKMRSLQKKMLSKLRWIPSNSMNKKIVQITNKKSIHDEQSNFTTKNHGAILRLNSTPNHDPFWRNHQGSLHKKPKLWTSKGKSHEVYNYTSALLAPRNIL